MAIGDVYAVKVFQTLNEQQLMNIFHYQQSAGSTMGAVTLATVFTTTVIPKLMQVVSNDIIYYRLDVESLPNPLDFTTTILTGTGTQLGTTLPSYDAWSYRLTVNRRDAKSGGKRLPGVTEGNQDDGLPTAGILTPLWDTANTMALTLTSGAFSFIPCILGKRQGSGDTLFANLVNSCSFVAISTQRSRRVK